MGEIGPHTGGGRGKQMVVDKPKTADYRGLQARHSLVEANRPSLNHTIAVRKLVPPAQDVLKSLLIAASGGASQASSQR